MTPGCWACPYGRDCCEGVWADLKTLPFQRALAQLPRLCLRCLKRYIKESRR